jgi:hypothetical protein
MNDKDNQLKTEEKSWLAGMIEGDGFVSVCVYKSKNSRIGVHYKPVVGVSNQDVAIINHVDNLFTKLGVNGFIQESTKTSTTPVLCISTSKFFSVKKILDSVVPYMVGQKKARTELVLKFINRRLGKMNSSLDIEDLSILQEMNNKFISHKGKKTQFGRILNEHTLSVEKTMMCSELIGDNKNE